MWLALIPYPRSQGGQYRTGSGSGTGSGTQHSSGKASHPSGYKTDDDDDDQASAPMVRSVISDPCHVRRAACLKSARLRRKKKNRKSLGLGVRGPIPPMSQRRRATTPFDRLFMVSPGEQTVLKGQSGCGQQHRGGKPADTNQAGPNQQWLSTTVSVFPFELPCVRLQRQRQATGDKSTENWDRQPSLGVRYHSITLLPLPGAPCLRASLLVVPRDVDKAGTNLRW